MWRWLPIVALLISPAQAQFCPRMGICSPLPSSAGPAPGGDPYWNNVKLLLSFDSAFTDESSATHGDPTLTGNPQIRNTFSVFGGSSAYFSGTVRMTWPNSPDWKLSNRKFTIEYWQRASSTGAQAIVGQWLKSGNDNSWLIESKTAIVFGGGSDGTNFPLTFSSNTISANTWYAVCIDFDGIKYRLYIDGVMQGSSTSLTNMWVSSLGLTIGAGNAGAEAYTGYIDEFRLTMDVARYASDSGYTVTTQPFPRR